MLVPMLTRPLPGGAAPAMPIPALDLSIPVPDMPGAGYGYGSYSRWSGPGYSYSGWWGGPGGAYAFAPGYEAYAAVPTCRIVNMRQHLADGRVIIRRTRMC